MPIFEFQCHACGLRFEQLFKTQSQAPTGKTYPCRECGEEAQKRVTAANHAFAHTPTGPGPQNTGVHQIDYNADRTIGRDAAKKWGLIEERQAEKRRVLRDNPAASGFDLRRNSNNEYAVMPTQEREMSERGRSLHQTALEKGKTAASPQSPPTNK